MQTLEHRVGILEKRVDNHGEEIDDLDDRVAEVESNQKLFQLQLEALTEIKEGIHALNKNVITINDAVTESKHKLEKLQLKNQASNNEIKRLEIVKEYLKEVKEKEGTENEQ